METYGHDFARLKRAFVDFVQRLPFYGVAVLCIDDANVREILPRDHEADRDLRPRRRRAAARDRHRERRRPHALRRARRRARPTCRSSSTSPACTTCRTRSPRSRSAARSASPTRRSRKALAEFNGVGRRFQRYGDVALADGGAFTLIDDYGHHPAEMAATIAAARGSFPGRRLVLAFQPHRYTRTRDLFEDFVARAVDRRRAGADRGLSGRRAADRRRRRPCARARGARRRQGRAGVRRGDRRRAGGDPRASRATATSSSRWAPARSARSRRSSTAAHDA